MTNPNCVRDLLFEIEKAEKPVTMKYLFKDMGHKYYYGLAELRKAYEFCYMWEYVKLLQPANVMICHKVTGLTKHGIEYLKIY